MNEQNESWLARNIQPVTVAFLLFSYFFFALLSVFNLETRGAYVDLLGQAMIIVITAIFAGKTAERIVDIRTKGNTNGT
jgi:polyferredoxin